MKPQSMATLSIVAFSIGLAMFFYFLLGWTAAADGYGAFGFFGVPSVALVAIGVLAQFGAIRGFKRERVAADNS